MSIADDFGGAVKLLTEEDLDGLELSDIECRSCSGYGNCGYKTYHLFQEFEDEEPEVVSICNRRKRKFECERDGIPFEE